MRTGTDDHGYTTAAFVTQPYGTHLPKFTGWGLPQRLQNFNQAVYLDATMHPLRLVSKDHSKGCRSLQPLWLW